MLGSGAVHIKTGYVVLEVAEASDSVLLKLVSADDLQTYRDIVHALAIFLGGDDHLLQRRELRRLLRSKKHLLGSWLRWWIYGTSLCSRVASKILARLRARV